MNKGTLFLIPCSLGESDLDFILPAKVKTVIQSLDEFIVENEKTARKFLKEVGITIPQSQLIIHEIDKHNPQFNYSDILKICETGKNIGLLSEAGVPAVADPGALVVKKAHEKNIRVVPLVGPSSILLALMASGMNGQQFCFHGYLPKEKDTLIQKIKFLEKESQQKNQTQIFIETPYRNNQLFSEILKICDAQTFLCIATDITLDSEKIITKKIGDWKKTFPDLSKKPTVFLIYSSN
ncbi:MAG: SAM-dependent methyltransferase [Bacteroidia bacterium]